MNPIQKLVQNEQAPKLSIFSGHDTTLVPLLMAFDVFKRYPRFSSNVIDFLIIGIFGGVQTKHFVDVFCIVKEICPDAV